jgi:hypothetical protein
MIYLMFMKPSLAESCLVVGGAGALYAGGQAVRRRLRSRHSSLIGQAAESARLA